MKKTITLLFALALVFNAIAQEHLSFKGVPIDGTLMSYTQKMASKGFVKIGTQNGISMLKGDFAGYKGCIVGVATLKNLDVVSKITVIFPECKQWRYLESNYQNLKEMLTEKYGEPSSVIEEFENRYTDGDEDKMYAVEFDQYKYSTEFTTDLGTIRLSIAHESVSSCFVLLEYFDKENTKSVRQQAIDDL